MSQVGESGGPMRTARFELQGPFIPGRHPCASSSDSVVRPDAVERLSVEWLLSLRKRSSRLQDTEVRAHEQL